MVLEVRKRNLSLFNFNDLNLSHIERILIPNAMSGRS